MKFNIYLCSLSGIIFILSLKNNNNISHIYKLTLQMFHFFFDWKVKINVISATNFSENWITEKENMRNERECGQNINRPSSYPRYGSLQLYIYDCFLLF